MLDAAFNMSDVGGGYVGNSREFFLSHLHQLALLTDALAKGLIIHFVHLFGQNAIVTILMVG